MDFLMLAQQCAPTVHHDTMRRVVQVESAFNPYAIGVVGAHLARQPTSLDEAMETIHWLDRQGYNYSVGLAQVNKHNFNAHGLTAETAFEPCASLRAGSAILAQCFVRARKSALSEQAALRSALSCYESGNFITGFRDSYVLKIVGARPLAPMPLATTPGTQAALRRARATRSAPRLAPQQAPPVTRSPARASLEQSDHGAQPSALLF